MESDAQANPCLGASCPNAGARRDLLLAAHPRHGERGGGCERRVGQSDPYPRVRQATFMGLRHTLASQGRCSIGTPCGR